MQECKNYIEYGINQLMDSAGIGSACYNISQCSIGGNNRIYKIDTNTESYVAKFYYKNDDDSRDRLGAEFEFLTYAKSVAPGISPQPYSFNKETYSALYEFIEGEQFKTEDINLNKLKDAINFFNRLNDPIDKITANSLHNSSESCFTFDSHIELVNYRIKDLLGMTVRNEIDQRALQFIKLLSKRWIIIKEEVYSKILDKYPEILEPLEIEQQCISPSDFGFHNAIAGRDGRTHFIDFEYAGWDDPSRMVADFFCQIAIPIPYRYFEYFLNEIMENFTEKRKHIKRAIFLLPIYKFKWCCIALNIFLSANLKRRLYANPNIDEISLKNEQIKKAEKIYQFFGKDCKDGLYRFHVGLA